MIDDCRTVTQGSCSVSVRSFQHNNLVKKFMHVSCFFAYGYDSESIVKKTKKEDG